MIRAAVIGVGQFGRNHARVIRELAEADGAVELTAVVDPNAERAAEVAAAYGASACTEVSELAGRIDAARIDAAIVAVPTSAHEEVTAHLLNSGVDVLVEKPIAPTSEAGERLTRLALERGRILQVGHLERFNPAVLALQNALTIPLFFEVHRLSIFTPRSLDVDVILDLMIHDLDIVLRFTGEDPEEVRAAGISVLSPKVDIANVRLAFPSGCIANLTASRVSSEQVRKLRLFQPGEYLSVDYGRQDLNRLSVQRRQDEPNAKIGFESVPVDRAEPLKAELRSFIHSVRTRTPPMVDGEQATAALRLAEQILVKIGQHSGRVAETFKRRRPPSQ